MKTSAQQRPRGLSPSGFTLLELIVLAAGVSGSIAAAVMVVHHVRDARMSEYRTGFVRGVLFAVHEGDDGGTLCGDDNPEMTGFHDGRFLVGRELSPAMTIEERAQRAEAAIRDSGMADESLNALTFSALNDLPRTTAK